MMPELLIQPGTRLYVASGFANTSVVELLLDRLERMGFVVTYDWTVHHPKNIGRPAHSPGVIFDAEHAGVRNAQIVIVLLPGGKGTHVELGLAIAYRVPVLLIGESELIDPPPGDTHPSTCVVPAYHHPLVTRMALPDGTGDALRSLALGEMPLSKEVHELLTTVLDFVKVALGNGLVTPKESGHGADALA